MSNPMLSLDIIVGGQFGSEAKGHVTHRVVRAGLGPDPRRTLNIRVAGPNAGHTVITDDGRPLALRTLPVGAATPGVRLHVAAGSEIDWDVLEREVALVQEHGLSVARRLSIDPQATLIDPAHKEAEAGLVGSIGSTGKGIGAARAARIMRRAELVADAGRDRLGWLADQGITLSSASKEAAGSHVVVEGTQGYGLGLHAGYYPQCTSSDCTATSFLSMAGLNAWDSAAAVRVWVVVRPHPIRVAGNSGPLAGETTWEALGLPPEHTTVTQKVRRVGEWDPRLVRAALDANGSASRLVLTMLDQVAPRVRGLTDWSEIRGDELAAGWLAKIEKDTGVPVWGVTTSPNTGASATTPLWGQA